MFKPWGVYDEFCLVEVLQPNRNLLIGGGHITYIPIVAINFFIRTRASGNYWSCQAIMATVRVTKDVCKALICKACFSR